MPRERTVVSDSKNIGTVSLVAIALLCGCVTVVPAGTPTAIPTIGSITLWPTPTIIQTQSIVEVTPLAEWLWYTKGTYTPTILDMNIRECSIASESCPVVGEVKLGMGVVFYALVRHSDSGDVWLCLDEVPIDGELLSQCKEMVAYILDNKVYGRIILAEPNG